jgi:hypothetical protein
MDLRLGLDLPEQLAVERQAVEVCVVRSDQHTIARDDRRGLDFRSRFERPARLAVRRAHGVQHTSKVTDEDEISRHRWG